VNALRSLTAGLVALCLAAPVWADARITVLMDLLRLDEVVRILRVEGETYASALDEDMLDGQGGGFMRVQVDRIYDPDKMSEYIRAGFEELLTGDDLDQTVAFYASDLGSRIVGLENAAREAMMDPDVEEAAKALYAEVRGTDDARLALIKTFVDTNELMDRNVAAAMSSNLALFNGLVDGKFISLTPDQMLREVWAQEEELRTDTEDWLFGFFLLAYQPLTLEELEAYVAFSTSTAGQAMNRALFAGHEKMYREMSYALGRAVALSAAGSTL
jgi:hypothetical protein